FEDCVVETHHRFLAPYAIFESEGRPGLALVYQRPSDEKRYLGLWIKTESEWRLERELPVDGGLSLVSGKTNGTWWLVQVDTSQKVRIAEVPKNLANGELVFRDLSAFPGQSTEGIPLPSTISGIKAVTLGTTPYLSVVGSRQSGIVLGPIAENTSAPTWQI